MKKNKGTTAADNEQKARKKNERYNVTVSKKVTAGLLRGA